MARTVASEKRQRTKGRYGSRGSRMSGRARQRDTYIVAVPQITQIPVHRRTIRYAAANAVSQTFNSRMLFGALGGIASGGFLVTPWVGALRIRKIDVYFTAQTAGLPVSSNINWVNNVAIFGTRNRETVATTMSIGNVTHMQASPLRTEVAGMWLSSETNTTAVFQMTVPDGAIVDVEFEYTLYDNELAHTAIPITNLATVGFVYYLALDGPASNNLVPQALSTIF